MTDTIARLEDLLADRVADMAPMPWRWDEESDCFRGAAGVMIATHKDMHVLCAAINALPALIAIAKSAIKFHASLSEWATDRGCVKDGVLVRGLEELGAALAELNQQT